MALVRRGRRSWAPRAALAAAALCSSFLLLVDGAAAVLDRMPSAGRMTKAVVSAPASSGEGLRPLVGILTQPTSSDDPTPYIAASYVKFVEMGGARAVPVFHNGSSGDLAAQFSSINGLILPGGGSDVAKGSSLRVAAETLLALAVEANVAGDVFPVHGTCLGFELLALMITQDDGVLSKFDAEDFASELTPSGGQWAAGSRLFSRAAASLLARAADVSQAPLAMENHRAGLAPGAFAKYAALAVNWTLLTTSKDRAGASYVSSMEHKALPFSGTQWHPEKAAFEWTTEQHIPHSAEAIALTQAIANYLVDNARLSHHRPPSVAAERAMIFANYVPTFTAVYKEKAAKVAYAEARRLGRTLAQANDENLFDQMYFF